MVQKNMWIGISTIALLIILGTIGYELSDRTYYCADRGIVMECERFSTSGNRCYPNLLDNTGYRDCSTGWIKLPDYVEPAQASIYLNKPEFSIKTDYIASEIDFGIEELSKGNYQVNWKWREEDIKSMIKTKNIDLTKIKRTKKITYLNETDDLVEKEIPRKLFQKNDDKKLREDFSKLNKYPIKNHNSILSIDNNFTKLSGNFTFSIPVNMFGEPLVTGKLFDLGFSTAEFTITNYVNTTYTNDNTPSINFTVIGNYTGWNVTLVINNTINASVLVSNNTPAYITANTLADGFYVWYLNATNVTTNSSAHHELWIDTVEPVIEWTAPTPHNNTYQNENYVYLNTSIGDLHNTSAFFDWNYSLVGYWSFDHTLPNGTIFDNSTYANDGTLYAHSTNLTAPGKYGQGIEFDGVGDYIRATSTNIVLADEISISAWINLDDDDLTKQFWIINDENVAYPTRLYISSPGTNDGTIVFYVRNDSGVANGISAYPGITAGDIGKWVHLVVTYNGTNGSIYKNGNKMTLITNNLGVGGIEDITSVYIGSYVTPSNFFNGIIDEVAIHNRVLTPQEINASYNNGNWRLYNNFTNLGEGNYNYTAYAIDLAGNIYKTQEKRISVDTTQPSFTSNVTNSSAAVSGKVYEFNITVNDTFGGSYYMFSWNDTGTWDNNTNGTWSGTSAILSASKTVTSIGGTVGYRWYANDSAGNWNQSLLRTFSINNTSPTTPVLIFPFDGLTLINTSLNFSSTDADDNIITYYIYINGTLNITTTTNVTIWNGTEGYYNWTVSAYDGQKSSANSSVQYFRIDPSPPAFQLNRTSGSMQYLTNLIMNITFYDISSTDAYRFAWNGTSGGALVNDSTTDIVDSVAYEASTTKQINLELNHYVCWQYWAIDTLGNQNVSNQYCFTVQPPASVVSYSLLNIRSPDSRTAEWNFTNESYSVTKCRSSAPYPVSAGVMYCDSSRENVFRYFNGNIWIDMKDSGTASGSGNCSGLGTCSNLAYMGNQNIGHFNITGNFSGNLIYGEMWNYSANMSAWTFPIASASVYYNLTGLAPGNLNGFTFTSETQANGGSYLTTQVSGLYKTILSMSFDTTGSGLYGVSVVKNFDVSSCRNCYSRRKLSATGNVGFTGSSCLLDLELGDAVNVQIEDEESPVKDLKIHTVNLNLVRIGD